MSVSFKEEYHYGNLRSMRKEYLTRTITKFIELNCFDAWVEIEGDGTMGDDKVEITRLTRRGKQTYKETHVSTICYEMAKELAC